MPGTMNIKENENVSNNLEKIKMNFLCTTTFSQKLCSLSDIVEKYDRTRQATDDNIIGRMRVGFWITKATNTHSENLIFLAFPQQQWLNERPPMAFYKHIACLVIHNLDFFSKSEVGTEY